MDSLRRIQTPSAVPRKEKKKQAKDEIDRLKQAEKKKRRLEKALATSAAIRSELEKKKQKKKEEQERLDEEGAAISEAVALHVLLGEDTDESCQAILNNNKSCNLLDHSSNIGLFMDCQSFAKYSVEEIGWLSDAYGSAHRWSDWDKRSLSRELHLRELQSHFYEDATQGTEISAGLVAAQAVSTLRIAENSQNDVFTGQKAATVVINRMLGGNDSLNKVNRYKYF